MDTRSTTSNTNKENDFPSSNPPQRLTPQKLEERREKGLCFSCDSKYSKGHKCGENKLFYIYYEEEEPKEQVPLQVDKIELVTPTISCHALIGINTPQTLENEGYIKKKMVTMLIDFGSTHNFIHCKVAKYLNYFVYPTPEFQVMIAYGGSISCLGKCHNINLTRGDMY